MFIQDDIPNKMELWPAVQRMVLASFGQGATVQNAAFDYIYLALEVRSQTMWG